MNDLQNMLSKFGCTVLNYTGNKIHVNYFYSEEMYNKYLAGSDCMQGVGLRNTNEKVDFSLLPDGVLVVVQIDGVESARYRYATIIAATIEFNSPKESNKKKSLTFHIRKQEYGSELNYYEVTGKKSLAFESLDKIYEYLSNEYGTYTVKKWDANDG